MIAPSIVRRCGESADLASASLAQQTSVEMLSLKGVSVVELGPRSWSCWLSGAPVRVAVSHDVERDDSGRWASLLVIGTARHRLKRDLSGGWRLDDGRSIEAVVVEAVS